MGGTGFTKALKKVQPKAKHLKMCHLSCILPHTTFRPNTMAGIELYCLSKDLFMINNKQEVEL